MLGYALVCHITSGRRGGHINERMNALSAEKLRVVSFYHKSHERRQRAALDLLTKTDFFCFLVLLATLASLLVFSSVNGRIKKDRTRFICF